MWKPEVYYPTRQIVMFRRYLFTGNAWKKYAKQNGIGAGNPANWLVNSTRTRQTGFRGFNQAITVAQIHFTFHDGKKTCFDCPNHTQFKFFTLRFLSRQNVENKFVLTNKFFFRNFARCEKTCITGPLECKYRVIFVLVLGVICILRSAVG